MPLTKSILSKQPRILLHYAHKQTLGHTTRTISLASAIMAQGGPKTKLTILQGGVPQPHVQHPEGCRILNVPLPFDTRSSFLARCAPEHTVERGSFILDTAKAFKPDIFITEFFPFGRTTYTPELLPTLHHLRKKGCKIIASVGYPLIVDLFQLQNKNFASIYKGILSFYDAFLIHTPEGLETPYFHRSMHSQETAELYAATLRSIENKIIYTGYIFPEQPLKDGPIDLLKQLPAAKNTVIVSRGGGAVYPKLIVDAIRAQRFLGKDYRMIIACGPSTSTAERQVFNHTFDRYGNNNVILADHLPNLNIYLKTCAVSVSLCGYNTSVPLMRYGTPAVIIPYQNKRTPLSTNDQTPRAKLLAEEFGSLVIPYTALTPQKLADAIRQRARQPRPKPAPASWFNGAAVSAKVILRGVQ